MLELGRSAPPVLTVGKHYLTEAQVRAATGTEIVELLAPGDAALDAPTVEAGVGLTSVRALTRYVDSNKIGARLGYGQHVFIDNVRCREWEGRHGIAEGATKPTIVSGGISLLSAPIAVDNFVASVAQFLLYQSWSAFFVVKRTVASFGGNAHVQFFGCDNVTTHQLYPFYFDDTGRVNCAGVVNGGATSGRTVAAVFPNATLKLFAVASKVGYGFEIYGGDGEQIDTANIGNGNGVSFSQFTGWADMSPVSYLGATRSAGVTTTSAGNCILYRNLFYGNLNPWDDMHKFQKVLRKLRIEYGL